MAKISDFEIVRESGFYFGISYHGFPVARVECDGDNWTAYGLGCSWRTKALEELFDKYLNSGKPSVSAVFQNGSCVFTHTEKTTRDRLPKKS